MRHPNSYRPISRKKHAQAIVVLKAQHPWLRDHLVDIAPGHLAIFKEYLGKCEQLMTPEERERVPMVCVTHTHDLPGLYIELIQPSETRKNALASLNEQTEEACRLHCAVCGIPIDAPLRQSSFGHRCESHKGIQGLFAEDVRRANRWKHQRDAATTPELPDDAKPSGREGIDSRGGDSGKEGAEAAQVVNGTEPVESKTAVPQIDLYDPEGVKTFLNRDRDKSDRYRRAESMVKRMEQAGGPRRALGQLPEGWEGVLEKFDRQFPNFAELTQLLRDQFALSALGDGRIQWPAVLLVGPPGIGKTEAASWLAEHLTLPFQKIDMATAQSNSALAGSEAFWSNSEPGHVFELLAYQPKANPIVVLDEIDKAGTHEKYNPLSALYGLLERRSARCFRDLSIRDFDVDASHINWMVTANCTDTIPAPILSRLTAMQIAMPTPEQTGHIAQTMYARLRSEATWGAVFPETLDAQVLALLQRLPPRTISIALRRALGSAARAKRHQVLAQDVAISVPPSRKGIGFV